MGAWVHYSNCRLRKRQRHVAKGTAPVRRITLLQATEGRVRPTDTRLTRERRREAGHKLCRAMDPVTRWERKSVGLGHRSIAQLRKMTAGRSGNAPACVPYPGESG